jgi:O-antigen/teichoic acid export membrane protein
MTERRPSANRAGAALLWQAVQTAGEKSIYVVRMLALAFLLSPQDYGLVAIAVVSVEFVMSLTDFGLFPALVQRRDPSDRDYHTAWTLRLVRSLAVSCSIWAASPWIADLFGEPAASDVIRVVALRPVIQATASMRVAALTRALGFRSLSGLKLSEALLNTVLAVALAPMLGVWAVVAGMLAGVTAGSLLSYWVAPYRPRISFDAAAAAELLRFGRWIFATAVIAAFGRTVLQATISSELGAAELGLYFLAAKLAFLPADLAAEAVGAVAFPVYARIGDDPAALARAVRANLVGIAALLIPPLALIAALAPTLTTDVLPERWAATAPVIQILVVASGLGLFGEVVVPIFKGLGHPARIVWLELAQSGLVILGVALLGSRFGVAGAAAAWIPATLASQAVAYLQLRWTVPRPLAGIAAPLAAVGVATLLTGGTAIAVDYAIPGWAGFLLAAVAGAGAAATILWVFDRNLGLGLLGLLTRLFPEPARRLGLVPTDGAP